MWYIGSPKFIISNQIVSTNDLSKKLLELVELDKADIVIGESYSPDFRSPTVSQWAVGLLWKTLPCFDINTGGYSLSFILKFFSPKKFNRIIYFIANTKIYKDFESVGAVIEFNNQRGDFLVKSVSLERTNKINKRFRVPCFKNENSELEEENSETSEYEPSLSRFFSQKPAILSQNYGNSLFQQIDVMIQLSKISFKEFQLIEVGVDGTIGIAELVRC